MPGLFFRSGAHSFDEPSWSVAARPSANWLLTSFWPIAWIACGFRHAHEVGWICVASCFVTFQLIADEFDEATFDCETSPSSPWLKTRVGALLLPKDGSLLQVHGCSRPPPCSVAASAPAPWWFSDSWPVAWMPPSDPQQCPRLDALPWVWLPCWSVQSTLPATAFDDAVFDCVTEPPSPWLRTRTGAFSFDAPCWIVSPTANASCAFDADCPIAWMPEP